jgi:hypothetical protein
MSGKEFGENWKFKMAAQELIFDEKLPFCLLITMVATK